MSVNDTLDRAPQALTYSVRELVLDARRGRIRVPQFQRDFKWNAEDVRRLFDSIYRGYPIGSLLLWRRPDSPAGPTRIGPVQIHQPEMTDVRWLVDGQQRVTSLTATLTEKREPDPRFDVFFDPSTRRFELPGARGPEEHWVPVHRLFDAADLGEFLLDWAPGLENRIWLRVLHDAGRNIRDYPIPAYLIESDDISVLREIFRRSNRSGKQLTEPEVFNALDRPVRGGQRPLDFLRAGLDALGWGEVDEDTLLAAALANERLNPTLKIDRQLRSDSDRQRKIEGASERLLPGFQATVAFLKHDASIPHRRLLPYKTPLIVLPALFSRHTDLTSRQRRLLVRWVWRGFITGAHKPEDRVHLREAAKLAADESVELDAILSRLLTMVPRHSEPWLLTTDDPRYTPSSAKQRVGLLALSLLRPHDLSGDNGPLDVSQMLTDLGSHFIQTLTSKRVHYRGTLANRVLHPKQSDLLGALKERARRAADDPALLSHAIGPAAGAALLEGDIAGFLELRARTIERVVADRVDTHAEWGADDTASLRALLERAS
jgi:hypothetical protein